MSYRYYINSIEVFPVNAGVLSFSYAKSDSSGFVFTHILESDIILNSQSGFDFFSQESSNKCEELPFSVEKNCGGVWSTYWDGVFAIVEGIFNPDKCTFTFRPRKKEFIISDIAVNVLDDSIHVDEGSVLGVVLPSAFPVTFPNARYFENTLLYVAKKANPRIASVISNLFQINPTGAFPLSTPNVYSNMVFLAMSDFQFPVPSNSATVANITFQDLMNDLNTIFDIGWFIDSSYNLRIEHTSFFDGVEDINIEGNKLTKNKNTYSYDLADYPKKETWTTINNRIKTTVTYGGLGDVVKAGSKNEKNYTTNTITTDLLYINKTTDGLILLVTDGGSFNGSYRILDENISLSPSEFVPNFHSFNRPSFYGLIDSQTRSNDSTSQYRVESSGGVLFDSIRPSIKQEKIKFPLCCSDFDVNNMIRTDFGLGYVQRASFDQKTEIISVDLKYKTENCENYDPLSLGDMQLWLKYNTGVTKDAITGRVSQWDDSSGNARHAVNANPLSQPLAAVGQPSAVVFNGHNVPTDPLDDWFLKTPAFQVFPSKRGTVIFIIDKIYDGWLGGSSLNPPSGRGPIISTNDGAAGVNFDLSFDELASPNTDFFFSANASSIFKTYPKKISSDLGLGSSMFRRMSDIRFVTRRNTVDCNVSSPYPNTQPASKALVIGGNTDVLTAMGGAYSNTFYLYELMIFSRELTDTELDYLDLYFTKKGLLLKYTN